MKNEKAEKMYSLYQEGFSLQDVGKSFGITRQSVFATFKCRGLELRKKNLKPFLMVDGLKFTINRDGYYECTTQDRLMLHNFIYEKYKSKIPKGYVIHHIDHNKTNNVISNLQILTPEDHSKLHNSVSGWNGMSKRVLCVETKEIFNSIAEVAQKHNQHPSNVSKYYIDGKRKLNGFTYEKID